MTPYIYISLDDCEPVVAVGSLGDDAGVEVEWPANRRGFLMAGRHVWLAYAQDGYTHSSTLDFPSDCGVELNGDEVHDLILQGIKEARERDG